MSKPMLVFDMDGVLVDVNESYREAIAQTVEHFTGSKPSREQIQEYKNQGGYNDDWKLSHQMVKDAGVEVTFESVVDHFQDLFHGNDTNALILREQWVARPGVLERLNQRFRFAVFTGRPKWEAELTLRRFGGDLVFDPVVGRDDVPNLKPAPDGLLHILKDNCDCQLYYVGDTVDDARSARAAKVPFIGVTSPANPTYLDLVFLFHEEKAYAIVDDINYLEEVFAE